jgi:hypothetical protein
MEGMTERTEPNTQLALIETQPDWRLDPSTRAIGREGVRKARAAMQAALAEQHDATARRDAA